jgi:hypothetical protein
MNNQQMTVAEITPIALALLGAAASGAAGSWLLIGRKLKAERSQLTKNEFTNVNEMVDSFIVSLQDKAERIQALYDTINELQRKLLEAENELIKLRGKHNDKRNDIVN